MDHIELGNTGIEVSRLCFGGLVIGPLQTDLSVSDGARVLVKALESGIDFIDTAELYGTYPHIREAVKLSGKRPVIATKSYAYSAEAAGKSVEKARRELDMDVLDIFLLHEQETRLTLKGHREALEYYLDQKAHGRIRAVGVSTHNIEVVEAICEMPEIDIVHPLINIAGIGIGDGNLDDMLSAVRKAHSAGKGVYSMKPLGGGNLLKKYEECMEFVLGLPFVHSIAVGMQSLEEVEMNVRVFEGRAVPAVLKESLGARSRRLHIDYWCDGCSRCVERCKTGALHIRNQKACADKDKCILCGYCASACPQFAIKIC